MSSLIDALKPVTGDNIIPLQVIAQILLLAKLPVFIVLKTDNGPGIGLSPIEKSENIWGSGQEK